MFRIRSVVTVLGEAVVLAIHSLGTLMLVGEVRMT
jgi:hypothetical protein